MSPPETPSATLSVRVAPRSSREEVAGFDSGVFRIRLNAPPVDGRANEALVRFLSRVLKVPKRRIVIGAGEKGRNKIVRIGGVTTEEAIAILMGRSDRTEGGKRGPEGLLG